MFTKMIVILLWSVKWHLRFIILVLFLFYQLYLILDDTQYLYN